MPDLSIDQMTQLAIAPAANDILYIGDVSEPVLDDRNKHIEVENLFQYLDGGYQGDIVLNAAATLNLQVGTVQLNEAVDLTATSTQLNAIAQLSGGDFTNFQHDHSDVANGGDLGNVTTGSITSAANVISMAADTDTQHILGPAAIGYDGTNTDTAHFAHIDHLLANNYAVRQAANGATRINAPTGQSVEFRINSAAAIARVNASGFQVLNGVLEARADTDTAHALGRAQIGYNGTDSDWAVFAHTDFMNNTDYGFAQLDSGGTYINCPSGGVIRVRIADVAHTLFNAAGITQTAGVFVTRSDEDTEHILGRAKVGYNGVNADSATFAHFDHMDGTGYSIRHTGTGQTNVNAPTGQNVFLRINNTNVEGISQGRRTLFGTDNLPPITPAALAADANDYQGQGTGDNIRQVVRVEATGANRTITGFDVQAEHDSMWVTNVGASNDVILAHQNAGSVAENRIISPTGADVNLSQNESAFLWYDGTTDRWRILFTNGT